ncbi:Site-specific recombinase (plasmid) [Paenibacillus bovis]|uniref:Site-specific recombinase n=1 Tax=Paenibacillus bovis TaxID=1616788 RepID=A0A1X9T4K7_9BACL|nr:Site-specific recombinase [Paenibacillus bovis]
MSAKDQSPERQLLKFKQLGINDRFIFIDKVSGKDFNRPAYISMRNMIRENDLIYLDSLDRLGRDYNGIIQEWKYITRDLQADIVCLDNAELFDSRKFRSMGDIGKLLEDQMLSLLAYVADVERKKNLSRQKEGIAVAKASGVKFGRPAVEVGADFIKQYERWKKEEITATAAYTLLGISKTTFYKKVKEYEGINV